MTIETSPSPQVSHKSSASAVGHAARGKAAHGGAAESAGGGAGFLSILGALGEGSNEATDLGPAGANVAPLDAAAGPASSLPPSAPFDASTLLQQNPQIAAAQTLQAAAGQGGTNAARPSAQMAALADGAGPAAVAALPIATAPVVGPASAGSPPVATAAGPALSKAGDAPSRQGALADTLGSGTLDLSEQTQSSTQGLQQVFARAKAGKATGPADNESSLAPVGKAVPAERADSNKFLASMEQANAASAARVVEPLVAPLLARQEKSQAERERRGAERKTEAAEATYAATAQASSAVDSSQPGGASAAVAPGMQVAEQVSYWVSHNVQNAELSLDGLGQDPVQVSISLQGNEAQISFRTDEAAAREVLQNAGVHLKDLLQREGLVLAGVTVGNAGSGNTDGGERRPRQNVRQTLIAPVQTSAVDASAGPRRSTAGTAGRSLDLFV